MILSLYLPVSSFVSSAQPDTILQFSQLVNTWIIIMLSAALVCFIISELTGNYSQVDKLWSIMPVVYSLVTLSLFPSVRIRLMTLLVLIWGLRLSYNFWRKGGYNIVPWKGEEDYRWKILREKPIFRGSLRFRLFNLFFISLYQHFLIMLISSPLLLAASNAETPLAGLDYLAAGLMVIFIIAEMVADNQLFRFQRMKKKDWGIEVWYCESLKKGFLTEDLWRYIRHPNYTAEQAIWISFWIFGVAASGDWFTWTIAGPLLLMVLFQGSSRLTENISRSRYPDYALYQKEAGRFLPRLF